MAYLTRLVDPLIDTLLAAQPAVLVVGPRAAGKTTTALRRAATAVHLDRESEAGAFAADPDAALRGLPEPVLLDEWQEVPGVLGAVKRAVDADPRPGRFIITGSVRGDLTATTWPGTGRLIRVTLHAMSMREQLGRLDGPRFFDRAVDDDVTHHIGDPPDLRGYVELALHGGFPAVIGQPEAVREPWLSSYVEQVITRDAVALAGVRDPARFRRYLQAYALASAGTAAERTLLDASGLDRKTANAYERLLADLFVVEPVPAWTSNRLQRLVHAPKRYLVDPSLLGAILRADVDTMMADADLLDRLIDTFTVSQLRAELETTRSRPVLYHVRDRQGRHEIDVLGEVRGGRVVACEIKATASPRPSDARHLAWLRDRLGDRFLRGVVLHTGPSVFSLDDKILAVPIAALWT
ncbi:MAG: ATP-binding protein [Acidimicrobiales bacterium]